MKKKLTAILCLLVALVTATTFGVANAFADGSGEPSTPSFYTDSVITFENTTDADEFDTTYLGWQIVDGKYYANGGWGTTYYKEQIDLTKTTRIAFDFCLSVPATNVFDNTMQFNVAIGTLDDINTAPCVHIHNSQQHGIYLNTLSDFSGVNNNWKGDSTVNYFDGAEHTFIIAIEDSKIKFYVDGVDLYPTMQQELQIPANNGYLILQSTDTNYYIDNLSLTEASVDVSVKELENDLDLNFTDIASSDAFYGLSGAWCRYDDNGNGILKPVAKWNSTRLNTKLSGNFTLSVDVHVALDEDPDSVDNYFRMGIMQGESLQPDYAGGYALVYSKAYGMCLYDDDGLMATPLINDATNFQFASGDGNFNVTLTVWDGTLTIKINDNYYYGSDDVQNDFDIEEGFITFEASNTAQCIDNLKVTKLSESPYPVPEPDPDLTPDPDGGNNGNGGTTTPPATLPTGKVDSDWWWIVLASVGGVGIAGLAVYLVIVFRKKK